MDEFSVKAFISWSTLIVILITAMIVLGMWGCPRYSVYQKELKGKAALKEAEQNRQIAIQEAKALYESANYVKMADSIRAEGIAIANEIIARSLTPEYIQWKWVEGLNDGSGEIIYIPTEANMPILEATRLQREIGIKEKEEEAEE